MAQTLFTFSDKQEHLTSRLHSIIVTVNKHGVLLVERDAIKMISVKHIKATFIDEKLIKSAVGSGDSFLGGLIYGLNKDQSLTEAIDLG